MRGGRPTKGKRGKKMMTSRNGRSVWIKPTFPSCFVVVLPPCTFGRSRDRRILPHPCHIALATKDAHVPRYGNQNLIREIPTKVDYASKCSFHFACIYGQLYAVPALSICSPHLPPTTPYFRPSMSSPSIRFHGFCARFVRFESAGSCIWLATISWDPYLRASATSGLSPTSV